MIAHKCWVTRGSALCLRRAGGGRANPTYDSSRNPERQAALGRQRHGGVDAGRLGADILGPEAAQQDRQGQRVLDLAHGAADAGTFAATERQVGVGLAFLGGVADPALGTELLGLIPVLGAVVRAIGKQRHLVAGADLLAVDDVGLGGDADQHPDRRIEPHRLLDHRARVDQRRIVGGGRLAVAAHRLAFLADALGGRRDSWPVS